MMRLALIGAGRMGAVHAEAIRTSPDAALALVVDPATDLAEAVADGAPVAADLDAALSAPDIDGIVVAAPTPLHPAMAAAAIAAGKPMLCEKPLSFDPGEAARLGAGAAEAGVVLAVGFWRRFAQPWAHAKRLISDGAIGTPIFARFSQWDADPPPPAFCARDVSGGLFIDCGVHEFELVDHLFGDRIVSVRSSALPTVAPEVVAVGDVDNGIVEMRTESGMMCLVDLARTARYGDDVRTEILGSEGALFVDGLPEARLRLADRDGVRVVEGTTIGDAMADGVANQLAAFVRAVGGDAVDLPNGRSSALATAVGLAAWESLDDGGVSVQVAYP